MSVLPKFGHGILGILINVGIKWIFSFFMILFFI